MNEKSKKKKKAKRRKEPCLLKMVGFIEICSWLIIVQIYDIVLVYTDRAE
jgi:hypothetical protein